MHEDCCWYAMLGKHEWIACMELKKSFVGRCSTSIHYLPLLAQSADGIESATAFPCVTIGPWREFVRCRCSVQAAAWAAPLPDDQ